MTEELTQEQIDAIESFIARRIENTGETRAQASEHISSLLLERLSKIEEQTSDADGRTNSRTTE